MNPTARSATTPGARATYPSRAHPSRTHPSRAHPARAHASCTRPAPFLLLLPRFVPLFLPFFLGGCGGNVTSGGLGEVEVQVSSDAVAQGVLAAMVAARADLGPASVGTSEASDGAATGLAAGAPTVPSAGARPEAGPGARPEAGPEARPEAGPEARPDPRPDPAPLQGTITVTVRSFLREGQTRWVEITDGPQEVVLPLDDPTPVVVARASLQEGEYEAVRTVFGRVRVEVTGGLEIGGAPFVGEIQIPVVGGGLLLAEERPFVVERRRPLPLLLELHAPRWLPFANRESRTVPEADFRREFRVRTPGR